MRAPPLTRIKFVTLTRILAGSCALTASLVTATGAIAAPAVVATRSPNHQRGSVIAVAPAGAMDHAKLREIAAGFPGGINVRNGVRLFRLEYWTVLKGKLVPASGLIAVPVERALPKGVMLYLHGTNATRALAPSQPDRVDGNEEAAVFGGNGFIVVLPDYIGLGVSRAPHPYLIVQPQVDASIDLLVAARSAAIRLSTRWPSNLFMMGFSQGGQVVAGLHRAIERRPVPGYRLRGSVGIAGPYDLRNTSLPKAIENECRQCVGYLTWAVYAYATYYGHSLGEVIKPQYVGIVPGLFDGSKTANDIGAALPDDPADMFQPAFLKTMRTSGDNWFTRALSQNETYAWAPRAPFRLYFGEDDVDVAPSASKSFFDYAKRRGGNVTLYSVAKADHQGSAAKAYAPTLQWFDAMARGK